MLGRGAFTFALIFLVGFLAFGVSISEIGTAQDDSDVVGEEEGEAPAEDEEPEEEPDGARFEDEFDDFDGFDGEDDEFDEDLEDLIEEAEKFADEYELEADAGTTPTSPFYFIDEFFDNFADAGDVREEKIAEMREMAEECSGGDENACEGLEIAFERYEEAAAEFEHEVAPEQREKAERSSRAIRGTLISKIAKDIPPTLKDEYVRAVIGREVGIETAAAIASKVKELCLQLAELDPLAYSRLCYTGDDEDAPDWRKRLDKDLTDQQRVEAKEFGEIMVECFRTSGETCRCGDISFTEFAEQCAIMAPLAYACDVLDDDNSCDKLDYIEENNDPFDLLPDYLHDVLDDIEDQYDDESYEHHIPRPCQEHFDREGIDPERDRSAREICFKIMIDQEAPPECRDALREANVDKEADARRICEKIMFETHGPEECREAGITDPGECGRGFDRGDFDRRGPDRGPGSGFDPNCAQIQDSTQRLECYDRAVQGSHARFEDSRSFDERYAEIKEQERQCAQSCSQQDGAWNFGGGECECRFDDHDYYEDYDYEGEHDDYGGYDYDGPNYDCAVMYCGEGSYCDPYNGCVSGGDYYPPEGDEYYEGEYDGGYDGEGSGSSGGGEGSDAGGDSTSGGTEEENSGGEESGGGGESDGGGDGSEGGGGGGTTGSVIYGGGITGTGNAFFDYIFGYS